MKICNICKQELSLDKFYKKRNSHEGFCKRCKEEKRKARFAADPTLAIKATANRLKRLSDPKESERMKTYLADYYSKNREVRDANTRRWYKNNPDKRLAMHRAWSKENPDVVRFHANKRRCAKLRAVPSWANNEWEQFLIEEIYSIAAKRQAIAGTAYHVDHVVPLQSDLVCGLHCAANLQILEASENISKSNKYWPDMW